MIKPVTCYVSCNKIYFTHISAFFISGLEISFLSVQLLMNCSVYQKYQIKDYRKSLN